MMTDPPGGRAGLTVGHRNAWKLDAQSSLTVPIAQLSLFHSDECAIERRERKHKLLPLLSESRTVDTYITLFFIINFPLGFPVWQIPKQRSTALLFALMCAGLAISLTDFSPCTVSPPSLSLSLSLHTHRHFVFTMQGFLSSPLCFSVYDPFYLKVSAVVLKHLW